MTIPRLFPYGPGVRWERLFEDLEGQLAAEWESERAALDSEAERLRLSRVRLRDRLVALSGQSAETTAVALADGSTVRGTFEAAGADFAALRLDASGGPLALIRTDAIASLTTSEVSLLHSARPDSRHERTGLTDRLTLGFVLRDLARRRSALRVHHRGGAVESGTLDRVGSDHFDLAVHDPGMPRRTSEVRAFRLVPFAAVAWIVLEDGASPALL